jgi:hypothetical protein
MNWIKRALRGEERLWKVFWIYGVVFSIILAIIGFLVSSGSGSTAGYVVLGIKIIYWIFLCIAQWRCAFNADWKIWGYVVRILLIIGIIANIALLALGGWLVSNKDKLQSSSSTFGVGFQAGIECAKETKAYQAKGGSDPKGFQEKCINDKLQVIAHPGVVAPATVTPVPVIKVQTPSAATPVVAVPAPAPVPTPPVTVTPPVTDQYKQSCEQTMSDYARKNGVDPQAYISKNQAYLQQCITYYANKAATGKNR